MLGLGLGLEGFDLSLEGRGLGPGLDMHVRLVAGDTHVFEVQYVMGDSVEQAFAYMRDALNTRVV